MDRELISLKFTMLRHSSKGLRTAGWVLGALLVVVTWLAIAVASPDARHSVTTLAFATWGVLAALGPVLMSGAGVLRPAYFTLLPLTRREVGRGLLLSSFVGIASGYVLLAFLALLVPAIALAPASVAVVLVGAPLTWILAMATARLVYALLGAAMRSRIGVEIAGMQWGMVFAAMFTGWMIVQVAIQSVPALLTRGIPEPTIVTVLDAFPTSWALLGVERAAAGDWGGAGMLLLALAALDAVIVLVTIPLLVPRLGGGRRERGRRRSAALVAGRGILPRTQLGAVIGKELRQWNRDAWRSLEVRSGVWAGIWIGGFALASGLYAGVAPFAGLIVAFMLGIAALSLYSQDGTAIWQSIVGEDETSVRADVRGRQWATVIIFLPWSVLISAVFVVLSRQWWAVPYLLAAMPAVFGAATGAAIITATAAVSPGVDPRLRTGPNDAVGNISIHVWVVIVLVQLGVLPTAGAVVLNAIVGAWWTAPLMIAIGVLNGVGAAWLFGRIAIRYLQGRMPDVYSRLRYGRILRAGAVGATTALDWLESTTQKGEEQYREQQAKDRAKKLAGTTAD